MDPAHGLPHRCLTIVILLPVEEEEDHKGLTINGFTPGARRLASRHSAVSHQRPRFPIGDGSTPGAWQLATNAQAVSPLPALLLQQTTAPDVTRRRTPPSPTESARPRPNSAPTSAPSLPDEMRPTARHHPTKMLSSPTSNGQVAPQSATTRHIQTTYF